MTKTYVLRTLFAVAIVAAIIGAFAAYEVYEADRLEKEWLAEMSRKRSDQVYEQKSIGGNDLEFKFMEFNDGTLSGRLVNTTPFYIRRLSVHVDVFDCPLSSTPVDDCDLIADGGYGASYSKYDSLSASFVIIKPGESRDFHWDINGLGHYNIRRYGRFTYSVTAYGLPKGSEHLPTYIDR